MPGCFSLHNMMLPHGPDKSAFDKAPWMNPPVRQTFGSDSDVAELKRVLKKIRTFMDKTGRVPFVGEFGANEARAVDQRATSDGMGSAAFASIGVQGCAWGYANTHQLWRDGKGWEPGIADAIVTTATLPPAR